MIRDQPHYLKPLKTTTVPKRLAFFDVATQTTRKGMNSEISWSAGALATRHETARTKVQRDTITGYLSPTEMWAALDRFCIRGKRVVLWTFDLPERLRTSGAMLELPRLGWKLETVVLEAGASWALWRSDDRSLLMCDLRSWTPYDWERINSAMVHAYKQGPAPDSTLSHSEALAYNRVRVIRSAVTEILSWIDTADLGTFKPTGSGQSYSAFRRQWLSDKILVHDDSARLDAERRSMWSGRVEAWRHGDLGYGPFLELDMKTAYSRIASESNVPTVAAGEMYRPTVERVLAQSGRYAYLCHVNVKTEVPCVPAGTGNHTIWPVGHFDTWIWGPELELLDKYASSVRVAKAYRYRVGPALAPFAAHVLEGLSAPTYQYGTMPQLVMKHWSRTLVGRFGLRYRSWVPFADSDGDECRMITYIDYDDHTMSDLMCVGDEMLLLGELTESVESVPQIPAWIMSECRARLFRTMCDIGFDRVVYVDTDSIIIDLKGDLSYGREVERHYRGVWAVKGQYAQMHVYGPRNIRVDADRRVSGLPVDARQLGPLEFRGEVMRSVKQSMRSGQLNTVVTVPRTFKFDAIDIRRGHNPDGSTYPFRVGETLTEDNL